MQFHNLTEYSSLMVTDREEKIKEYVLHLRSKEASKSQFKMLFATLKNFYEMNDVEDIKWRKLKRYVGEEIPEHDDRRYTHEEVDILVQNANLKLKSAILLMASSGCRVGAVPSMLVGHLERRGDLYKINVYKGQKGKGQYYTFCTPECARAIDAYLELRERCGEKITPNSPLFRMDFDTGIHEQARNAVKPWTLASITQALRTLLILNGLVVVDHVNTKNRKEVKRSHGFRKFFVTMLVNSKLQETIISKLSGHAVSKNLTQVYSKQTEPEMLAEYEKAIDSLTIDPANRLSRELIHEKAKNTETSKILARLAKLEGEIGIKI
jgi:integrase